MNEKPSREETEVVCSRCVGKKLRNLSCDAFTGKFYVTLAGVQLVLFVHGFTTDHVVFCRYDNQLWYKPGMHTASKTDAGSIFLPNLTPVKYALLRFNPKLAVLEFRLGFESNKQKCVKVALTEHRI